MTPTTKARLILRGLVYGLLALGAVMAVIASLSALFTLWNVGHLALAICAQALGFQLTMKAALSILGSSLAGLIALFLSGGSALALGVAAMASHSFAGRIAP